MAEATVLLFDVDGTLVRCGGAGRRAMEAAFGEIVGRDDVCDFGFAGMTDRLIARRGLTAAGMSPDEEAIDALLERYLVHLVPALREAEGYEVLDGVTALLEQLAARRGVALGLGTGNVEAGARTKLAHGGLGEEFSFGGFGCDHEERDALIAAGVARGVARLERSRAACRVWVIGDTPRDVTAARANQADCLGVATGPFSSAQLREAGATMVVEDLTDPRVLTTLLRS